MPSVQCKNCKKFMSMADQAIDDKHCKHCRPSPVSPNDSSTTLKEEKVMKLWMKIGIAVVLVAGLVLFAVDYVKTRNQIVAPTQEASVTNHDDTIAVVIPITTATPAPATTTATNDDYIVVYRGDTDQETINFDDAWPGYYTTDDIDWSDNSFHMLGGNDTIKVGNQKLTCGTYTVERDGIVSGDVLVNGVKICDDDENTFLVIQVEKGDKVTVINDWGAWFTSHYDESLVVAARQAAHPTWTRQESELN